MRLVMMMMIVVVVSAQSNTCPDKPTRPLSALRLRFLPLRLLDLATITFTLTSHH